MSTVKPSYLSPLAVHMTLDGLATAASRQSDSIDNTANLYDDFLVYGQFEMGAGALGANPNITIYLAGAATGTLFADGLTGTDATFTAPAAVNVLSTPILYVPIAAASTLYYVGRFSLAQLTGGTPLDKFAFWATNTSGQSLVAAPATTSVTAVTNVTNPQITTGSAHGLIVGQTVTITGTVGATGINGTWVVATRPSTTTFTIVAAAPGVWSSAGTVQPVLNALQLIPVQYTAA